MNEVSSPESGNFHNEILTNALEIERPLRDGYGLHVFREQDYRVVDICDSSGRVVSSGRAEHVGDSFARATFDYLFRFTCGHEYGDNSILPDYISGTPEIHPSVERHLDWNELFANFRDNMVVVTLVDLDAAHGYMIPETLFNHVNETGESSIWEARGIKYLVKREITHGISTVKIDPIDAPGDIDPWYFVGHRTGIGETFRIALSNAFVAPQVEIMPTVSTTTQLLDKEENQI